jgi:hypothetical protein
VDPVATCVEVRSLVRADLLVEIEVDAVVRLPPGEGAPDEIERLGDAGG